MKKGYLTCLVVALIAAVLSLNGCETNSATDAVTIDPNSAVITKGDSVTFTASGGYDYTWSLKNDGWGSLSTRRGDTTVYTSIYQPASNSTDITQILTVTSTIKGSSTSTNGSGYQVTGEAYITHR